MCKRTKKDSNPMKINKEKYHILVINLGSTSSKICYYINDILIKYDEVIHPNEKIEKYSSIWEQFEYRKNCIIEFCKKNKIEIDDLDAIVSRGGHTKPIKGGVYRINKVMLEQSRSEKYGNHASDLGLIIATNLAKDGVLSLTVDPPTTDEFEPLARYSGLKELPRRSSFHALNQRAVGKEYSKEIGKEYEKLNLIVVHLGGGITVAAHVLGKMIDANNGILGDGPFSTNRCGTVPIGSLLDLCFSNNYTIGEIKGILNGKGGLISYLGENNVKKIEEDALDGDKLKIEVLEAMCYQVAKEIGACSTVMKGKVDAILFSGGIAKSKYITSLIIERVKFIAPIKVYPGEYEMKSLADGAYRALKGEVNIFELS